MKTKLLLFLLLFSLFIKAQTNLVPNGNFENWSSSTQPSNWFQYINGYISQSTTAQNGSSSTNIKIANGTFNFINSEYFPVVASKTYRVTLYHKLVSGTFSSLDFSVYHKPGTFKEEVLKNTAVTFSSSEWTKIEFDYTPTTSENIEVDIWATGTLNSELLVDNVSVVDVTDIPLQYTLIPDANFERALISLGLDSDDIDGQVLTSNISGVTGLNLSFKNISSLKGIEDFTSLTTLFCTSNLLTTIDLSKNTNLGALYCDDNQIYSLNLSKNTALKLLNCSQNQLYNFSIADNSELTYLNVSINPYLTKLDVTKNTKLINLSCHSTAISRLDISKNVALTTLDCKQNIIMDLDLSYNVLLTSLNCSKNTNTLTTLNLKNGNNKNLSLVNSDFKDNPHLTCIKTDDEIYSNDNWSSLKDAAATYNNACTDGPYTLIPDPNFEKALINAGVDYRELDGKVLTENILLLYGINLNNNNINDLTGIEGFANLKSLSCKTNNLTSLDLSKNIDLISLDCSTNKLTSLNLSQNPNFTTLNSSSNPNLTCIKVNNVAFSEANWTTIKDASANYSTSCTLGLEDSEFNKAVVYPNPTKGELNILNIAVEKATVYNSLGQLVKTFTLDSAKTNNTINLSGLPKGVYYLYLINQDAASAKKVIVE